MTTSCLLLHDVKNITRENLLCCVKLNHFDFWWQLKSLIVSKMLNIKSTSVYLKSNKLQKQVTKFFFLLQSRIYKYFKSKQKVFFSLSKSITISCHQKVDFIYCFNCECSRLKVNSKQLLHIGNLLSIYLSVCNTKWARAHTK